MRRLALGVVAALLLLGAIAQLLLPGIAADRLRDRLSHSGRVLAVEVEAFPAVELLWGDAEKAVVRMDSYASHPGHLNGLLDQAARVNSVDASAGRLQVGPLVLHDATLHKRGDRFTASATVRDADVHAALPILSSVGLVASASGRVILQGTAAAFGLSVTLQVVVAAQDGNLVASPDLPFGGLATITLFSSPHLKIEGVSGQPSPGGFTVTATARLR